MSKVLIITALMPEAVPIIDFYGLKRQEKTLYTHYAKADIDLVICGMGHKKMAKNLAAFLSRSTVNTMPYQIYINIGIAGTEKTEIGCLVWADTIAGEGISAPDWAQNKPHINITSLNQPSKDYQPNTLFDMEAEACLKTLKQKVRDFNPKTLFCAKVISDNQQQSTALIDSAMVQGLLRSKMPEISKII